MKPFNLKRAKAGDPIRTNFGVKCKFIGMRRNGNAVVELDNENLVTYDTRGLRMAPKKRKVWINFYRESKSPGGEPYVAYFSSKSKADDAHAAGTICERIGNRAYSREIAE